MSESNTVTMTLEYYEELKEKIDTLKEEVSNLEIEKEYLKRTLHKIGLNSDVINNIMPCHVTSVERNVDPVNYTVSYRIKIDGLPLEFDRGNN